MLKSFLKFYPQSALYAFDVSSHNKHIFENLAGFRAFYDDLDSICERFDCISLIHCLEHIIEAKSVLARLRDLLSPQGVLLIQVPDVAQDMWDIFTYDHCHHFSPRTLKSLLESVGFEVSIPHKTIARQITMVARKARRELELESLSEHLGEIERVRQEGGGVQVFGSTNRSTFIGALVGESLVGFLDEDRRKVGKTHLGKPITAPSLKACQGRVLLPLGKELAQRLRAEYPQAEWMELD